MLFGPLPAVCRTHVPWRSKPPGNRPARSRRNRPPFCTLSVKSLKSRPDHVRDEPTANANTCPRKFSAPLTPRVACLCNRDAVLFSYRSYTSCRNRRSRTFGPSLFSCPVQPIEPGANGVPVTVQMPARILSRRSDLKVFTCAISAPLNGQKANTAAIIPELFAHANAPTVAISRGLSLSRLQRLDWKQRQDVHPPATVRPGITPNDNSHHIDGRILSKYCMAFPRQSVQIAMSATCAPAQRLPSPRSSSSEHHGRSIYVRWRTVVLRWRLARNVCHEPCARLSPSAIQRRSQ